VKDLLLTSPLPRARASRGGWRGRRDTGRARVAGAGKNQGGIAMTTARGRVREFITPPPKLPPRPWYTATFCGKLTGDGAQRMHLQDIVNRIDQRLESLGISALEAERRAGRRDAIRNMRRAVARGKGGVTMRTIDALAPALSTTSEWLLTGQEKSEADETTEIILLDKRSTLDDDRVIEAFGLAFQSLVGKLITEVEAHILARSVVRIIRLPEAAMTQAERRDMIRASVRLFRH
jgi:transcriptional regulator with XRE-family HTH domain